MPPCIGIVLIIVGLLPVILKGDRRLVRSRMSAISLVLGRRLSRYEREQCGVHHIGVGGAHAVRKFLVDLESSFLQQLR